MNRFTYFLSLLLFMSAVSFSHGQKPLGDWAGMLNAGPQELKIVFHITEEKGALRASMDSPDQGVFAIPMNQVSYDSMELSLGSTRFPVGYKGRYLPEKQEIRGVFLQSGFELPLTLSLDTVGPDRPQTPKAPFPYEIREVSYQNEKEDISLSATLTLPEGEGPFPALILITGSGPQDRDGSMFQHKPFWVIADAMGRKGIAVLRYDERGVGKSEGDFGEATSEDFATDVQAGIDYLLGVEKVDPQQLGLIGHSEGGLIAPMVAAADPRVKFVITLAGPALPSTELLPLQQRTMLKRSGIADSSIQKASNLQQQMFDVVLNNADVDKAREILDANIDTYLEPFSTQEKTMLGLNENTLDAQVKGLTSPWMGFFLKVDPRDYLKQLDIPLLAIYAGKDFQVPAEENLEAFKPLVEKKPQFVSKTYPGLNHLFQEAETGLMTEYGQLTETFSNKVILDMIEWIKGL